MHGSNLSTGGEDWKGISNSCPWPLRFSPCTAGLLPAPLPSLEQDFSLCWKSFVALKKLCWKSAQEYIGASYGFMKLCLKVSRFWVATMSWGETKNILKGLHGLQPCLTVVGHFLYNTFPSSPISKLLILLQGLLKFHFSVRKMTWAFRLSGTGPIEGQSEKHWFFLTWPYTPLVYFEVFRF